MAKTRKTHRRRQKTILWVDDEAYAFDVYVDLLGLQGFKIIVAHTASEALHQLKVLGNKIDLAVLDIMLPPGPELDDRDTYNGRRTGLVLAQMIRERFPRMPIVGLSALGDPEVADWFNRHGSGYFQKPALPVNFIDEISRIASKRRRKKKPRCFVVHGHDHKALFELKNYIQNTLGLDEPIVLREQPSLGRTLIEKFEQEARRADLVFVLLTPDDRTAPKRAPNRVKRRARQNVIFELGFFYATFQRRSGRVLILHKGMLEIPSDLEGLVYIDISRGVEAAGEELRRELADWL